MMMRKESEKYNKIVKLLRESKPFLNSAADIQREVIKKISLASHPKFDLSEIIEFLFGWVYISWVRRSLIAASVMLVVFFIWQQGMIMKQINYLSRQTIIIDSETSIDPAEVIEKRLLIYKLSGRMFPSQPITISEKQMNQLLDSVKDLQVKYKLLKNLIEEDPELKKYIENKLNENNRTKIKL
jgi:hypothetical protein